MPLDLPRVDFFHWVIANLPPDLREIPEGSHSDGITARGKAYGPTPHGGLQGLTDYTSWFAADGIHLSSAGAMALAHFLKAQLDARWRPDGYNVGWNCGAAGGQTVMHAHLHVIPRFAREPLAGQGIRAWLKSDANRW